MIDLHCYWIISIYTLPGEVRKRIFMAMNKMLYCIFLVLTLNVRPLYACSGDSASAPTCKEKSGFMCAVKQAAESARLKTYPENGRKTIMSPPFFPKNKDVKK